MEITDSISSVTLLQENSPFIAEAISQTGLPEQAEMYDLLDFLEVTNDNYFDAGIQGMVKYIYNWAKGEENPVLAVKLLDSKLGMTTQASKLTKLYSHLKTQTEIKSHLEIAKNLMEQI